MCVCKKQVSKAETNNYIPQIVWDVITCPCPWYLLLYSYVVLVCSLNSMCIDNVGTPTILLSHCGQSRRYIFIVSDGIALSPIPCTRWPSKMSSTRSLYVHDDVMTWKRFQHYFSLRGEPTCQNPPVTCEFPSKSARVLDALLFSQLLAWTSCRSYKQYTNIRHSCNVIMMYLVMFLFRDPNKLTPRYNSCHFSDDNFKWNILNENVSVLIKNSLKLVSSGPINNIPALVQIMAWRLVGAKPLSEPMMGSFLTHICATRQGRLQSSRGITDPS